MRTFLCTVIMLFLFSLYIIPFFVFNLPLWVAIPGTLYCFCIGFFSGDLADYILE